MTGLILNLKPNEKFLVNGIVLANGPKRGQIKIEGDEAKVLRLSDAMHPDDVDTPVKRVYYAAQLVLSCDLDEAKTQPELVRELRRLEFALMEADSGQMTKAVAAAEKGHYYSVLCHLKRILPLEAELLAHSVQQPAPQMQEKVSKVA
jgi:flagellar protein FlbT